MKAAPRSVNLYAWNDTNKHEQNTPKKSERSAASAVKRSENLYAKGNTKKGERFEKTEGERSHTKRLETYGFNLYYNVLCCIIMY